MQARDKFRNSDHLTLSIETRSSCKKKPDLATVAKLHSSSDLLMRDRTSYNASGLVEAGKPHLLRLRHVSSSGAVTTTCGNSGVWQFEPGKHYVLEVRNWSSGGGTGKDLFGKFGCEWNMTNAETGRLLPETRPVGRPVCGDD